MSDDILKLLSNINDGLNLTCTNNSTNVMELEANILSYNNVTNGSNGLTLGTDTDCIIREHIDGPSDVFSFVMYGVLLNIVGLIGLVGNVFSILVLSR